VAAAAEINQRRQRVPMKAYSPSEPQPFPPEDVDVLALLRGLAQGDGAAEGRGSRSPRVTMALLTLLVQHLQGGWGSQKWRDGGVLRFLDVCATYWVLTYRCRLAPLMAGPADPPLLEVDRPGRQLLARLTHFLADPAQTRLLLP